MKSILLTTSTLPRFISDLTLALSKYCRVTLLTSACSAGLLHDLVGAVEIIRYGYALFRGWERLAYPGAILLRLRAMP
ncbi:MAG: hypothetical protein KJ630_14115 [Proteobacteria bacterium]|nr:hypothetical protein [Pseudomonadota bacterium]